MMISLEFGLSTLQYSIGSLSRTDPELFPFMVSCLLFLIGVVTVVRSRFVEAVPLDVSMKNIALVLLGLCGFAVVSKFINMTVGIVFMVFVATLAGTSYSWKRNLKICAGLIAIAFAFQKLLGLNLPLY